MRQYLVAPPEQIQHWKINWTEGALFFDNQNPSTPFDELKDPFLVAMAGPYSGRRAPNALLDFVPLVNASVAANELLVMSSTFTPEEFLRAFMEALFPGALVNSAPKALVTNTKDYGDFKEFLRQTSLGGAGLVPPTGSPLVPTSGSTMATDVRSGGRPSSSRPTTSPSPKSPSPSNASSSISHRDQRELDRECKGGDPNCHRHASFGVVCRCGGIHGPVGQKPNSSAVVVQPAAVIPLSRCRL
jgi:hypothetical protein